MRKKNDFDERQEAVVWCIKNDYKIYPVTTDNSTYQVCVTRGSDKAIIKTIYKRSNIDKAISDVCVKIYRQKTLKQ